MGKIIERVRAREVQRKERIRRQSPLYSLMEQQQRAMTNAYDPRSPLWGGPGMQNAMHSSYGQCATPHAIIKNEPDPLTLGKEKPWWRFW